MFLIGRVESLLNWEDWVPPQKVVHDAIYASEDSQWTNNGREWNHEQEHGLFGSET